MTCKSHRPLKAKMTSEHKLTMNKFTLRLRKGFWQKNVRGIFFLKSRTARERLKATTTIEAKKIQGGLTGSKMFRTYVIISEIVL